MHRKTPSSPPNMLNPSTLGPSLNGFDMANQNALQMMRFPVWTSPGQNPRQPHFAYHPGVTAQNGNLAPPLDSSVPTFGGTPYNYYPRMIYGYGPYAEQYENMPNPYQVELEKAAAEKKAAARKPVGTGEKLKVDPRSRYKLDYSKVNRGDESNKDQQQGVQNGVINALSKKKTKKFNQNTPYSTYQPTFDWYLVQSSMIPSKETEDFDRLLEEQCIKRLHEIASSVEDLSALAATVTKVSIVLEKLKLPGACDACRIDSIDQVGPYRMGTMLKGNQTADFVVTLRTLPVKAALQALGNKMLEELQKLDAATPYHVQLRENFLELIDIYAQDTVQIHFSIIPELIRKVEKGVHVKRGILATNTVAVRQAKWFDDATRNAPNVSSLIRIMSDIGRRFNDFQEMTLWMITVLCHYAITRTHDDQPVPFGAALKRILQVLSAGIFLPYSSGIADPVNVKVPIHAKLTTQKQEAITRTAQTLFRILTKDNGINFILGLKPLPENTLDALVKPTEWNGVLVNPSRSVFESEPSETHRANSCPYGNPDDEDMYIYTDDYN